jgi:ubiquinone biosynthesis monooxygenase Coq7
VGGTEGRGSLPGREHSGCATGTGRQAAVRGIDAREPCGRGLCAREETDHLAWTQERIRTLGGRESLLNPLWFAGAFGLGVLAASISDKVSLGFVAETEDQVAAHLDSHLQRLPAQDTRSRTIVARMKSDEERHAAWARRAGAVELPPPARWLMRAAAKVMTSTAHHI